MIIRDKLKSNYNMIKERRNNSRTLYLNISKKLSEVNNSKMNQQKFYLLFAYSKITIDHQRTFKIFAHSRYSKEMFSNEVDNTNKKITFLHFNSNF